VFFVSLYFDLFTKFVVLCFILCLECHGATQKVFFFFFFFCYCAFGVYFAVFILLYDPASGLCCFQLISFVGCLGLGLCVDMW